MDFLSNYERSQSSPYIGAVDKRIHNPCLRRGFGRQAPIYFPIYFLCQGWFQVSA